jgi:mono/diheme cytochrome c family protein
MKRRMQWTFGLVAMMILVAGGAVGAGGDAAKGKAVFTAKCGSCHSLDGEAKPAIARMLKVEMKNLSAKEVQAKSDAVLRKEIAEGTGKMKGIKLTDEEMANVLAFLRTLAKK